MKNFKIENIDVENFLDKRLKLRNVQEATETEIRFSCPFPGHTSGDENPSAYMNKETTAWICHGCKRKGNAVTFISDLYNVSTYAAIRKLKEFYGGAFENPESTIEDEINRYFLSLGKPDVEPLNFSLQLAVLSDFKMNPGARYYLRNRGFNDDTMDKFQLGYDEISGRIVIPIFDESGRLVGFKGRSVDPEDKPKYKVLGGSLYGFPRYHVGLVVFGIDKVPEEKRTAIICEGELNAIAMHQMGFDNAIAAGGSTFTDIHARKIVERFDSAILYFDSDKAGNEATINAAKLLMPHMPVRVVPDHDQDAADVLQTYIPRASGQTHIGNLLSESHDMLSLMVE